MEQNSEVEKSVVKTIHDIARNPGVEMIADIGVVVIQFTDRIGQKLHGAALAASDVDVACDRFSDGTELRLGLLHHRHDLFRTLAQKKAFRRQGDMPAVPVQKFLAEFVLQVRNLTGQGRLGDMKIFRRLREAALPCNRKKITQQSEFHFRLLSPFGIL